uniref:Thioredoxin-like n=1 Tax=Labrus bergylta TaxID=56723 RepID=A0A3Q3E1Y6_9LABR
MVREVENLDFQNILKEAGDKLVVVDFTATWCGPCKQIGPKFVVSELFSLGHSNRFVFLKSGQCKISCMPTFQFYKNGVKIDEFSGANAAQLVEKIQAHRT